MTAHSNPPRTVARELPGDLTGNGPPAWRNPGGAATWGRGRRRKGQPHFHGVRPRTDRTMKLSPRLLRHAGLAGAATAAAILIPVTALAATARPAAPQAAASRCTVGQLVTWIGLPGDGAAGHTFYELEFSNISARACSLTGFPGVSAVHDGTQVGSPADRNPSHPVTRVTLARGATAHAILGITDVGVFPPSACQVTAANQLRVFAPNDFIARGVPLGFAACQRPGEVFLQVSPVIAGTGIPNFSN
jgi:hypothetical protein